jgi:hypothetical protein
MSLRKLCVFLFVNCIFIFRIANTFVASYAMKYSETFFVIRKFLAYTPPTIHASYGPAFGSVVIDSLHAVCKFNLKENTHAVHIIYQLEIQNIIISNFLGVGFYWLLILAPDKVNMQIFSSTWKYPLNTGILKTFCV